MSTIKPSDTTMPVKKRIPFIEILLYVYMRIGGSALDFGILKKMLNYEILVSLN